MNLIVRTMSISDSSLAEIGQATLADQSLTRLKQVITDGWPKEHYHCPRDVQPFWNVQDELSVADEVVFKGTRIIVILRQGVMTYCARSTKDRWKLKSVVRGLEMYYISLG